MAIQLDTAFVSMLGGRKTNEDACGYWTSDRVCCWVLSDGAGGHGGGDQASRLVVRTILRDFASQPQFSSSALHDALDNAQSAVYLRQRLTPELRDMRATAVVLLLDCVERSMLWAHVGDSRLYVCRSGEVVAQTRDDTVVQGLIEDGTLEASAARTHPRRNILLRAIGSPSALHPNISESVLPVEQGDALLLCSDGFWGALEDEDVARSAGEGGSAQQWLDRMTDKIAPVAPRDNYSAVAVKIVAC